MKLLYAVIFSVLAAICLANGCNHSDGEKVQQLYEAACNGNAEAQYILGLCYVKGKGGIEPDAEEAFKWIYKAAEQGYAKAQVTVSCFYEDGAVVEKDLEKADYWRRKAIAQGLDVPPVVIPSDLGKERPGSSRDKYVCSACRDLKTCFHCKGSGWVVMANNTKWACTTCFGTGECPYCAPAKNIAYQCNYCEGSGKCSCTNEYYDLLWGKGWCDNCGRMMGKDNPCSHCKGKGEIYVHREAGENWRP